MREMHSQRLAARDVRRSLTASGDVRGEIAFQNDVNSLLAALERKLPPWEAAGGAEPSPAPAAGRDAAEAA
jgi:hypothetical protein